MSPKPRITLPHGAVPALFAILLYISTGLGCSTASLNDVWKDPEYRDQPMTNMLVVAAMPNPVNRRMWEDEISAMLLTYGTAAIPSYRLCEDSIPNPDQVGAAVKEKNIGGVLLIRKLPTETTTNYVQGTLQREQMTRYDPRTRTYATVFRDIYLPGYTDTSRVVRFEVNVLATPPENGRLVWAGTGSMTDPNSRKAVRDEIVGLIAPELARQGIIPVKK